MLTHGLSITPIPHHNYIQCMCMCSVSQLCPTLCDSLDCSLPGSSVHGVFQRILKWVYMFYSGDLLNPGIEFTAPASPALKVNYLLWAIRKHIIYTVLLSNFQIFIFLIKINFCHLVFHIICIDAYWIGKAKWFSNPITLIKIMFSRILALTFRVNRKWKINTLPDVISNEWGIKYFA